MSARDDGDGGDVGDADVRDPDSAADAPTRRGFLGGLATALAAAAVVRPVLTKAPPAPRLPRWIGHS